MKHERLQVVLVRTRNARNLGAAARAMKNFGLTRLTLVDPQTSDGETARQLAVHADDVLAAARTVSTLAEAIGDARWVLGTSGRGLADEPALTPREVAERASLISEEGDVALVFGDEQSGLSHGELLACHAVSTIPTSSAYSSLNLAQSVVVYANALWTHAPATNAKPPAPRAREDELLQLEHALREVLTQAAFSDVDRPGHGVAELAHTLRRSGLSAAEARLWQAALRRTILQLRGTS